MFPPDSYIVRQLGSIFVTQLNPYIVSIHIRLKFYYLIGPFNAGPNLTPALITPGKEFGLPPLWATVNAIQKCRILNIDKDIIYVLFVIFVLTLLIINQKKFSTNPRIFVWYLIFIYRFYRQIQL